MPGAFTAQGDAHPEIDEKNGDKHSSVKDDKGSGALFDSVADDPSVPVIWLCRYRRDEEGSLEGRLKPGKEETWPISSVKTDDLLQTMAEGDIVALWRTVDKNFDPTDATTRGGIVGWARITGWSDDGDQRLVKFKVRQLFRRKPISRDQVLIRLNRQGTTWPELPSFKKLTKEEAHVFDQYMTRQSRESQTTGLSSDKAESTRDLLGRAPLASVLAHHINRIWTEQTAGKDEPSSTPAADEDAFVLHIDAPWGGGKTTFANFVARILNPEGKSSRTSSSLRPASQESRLYPSDAGEPPGETSRQAASEPETAHRDAEGFTQQDDPVSMGFDMRGRDYWPEDFKDRRWIAIRFNAWQNEHISPPWWNFYTSVVKQCFDQLPTAQKWFEVAREWLWRILNPSNRNTLLTLIVASAIFYPIYGFLLRPTDAGPFAVVTAAVASGGASAAVFRAIRAGLSSFVGSVTESIDAERLGETDRLRRFKRHFAGLIARMRHPVLVIIDDLDRCEPRYVVELIRGLLTIFRSRRVVFMLLGDRRWIEHSFAQVHEGMNDANGSDQTSFGGRFAEKAIQLSFILPEPDPVARDAYIDALLSPQHSVGERMPESAEEPEDPAPAVETTPRQAANTGNEHAADTSNPSSDKNADLDLEDFKVNLHQRFSKASDTKAGVRIFTEEQQDLASRFNEAEANRQEAEGYLRDEFAMFMASRAEAQDRISHSLRHFKSGLPDNPRRIKRIINMIAAYQASGQAVLGIDPHSAKWRQLVLWIILVCEHPEVWRTLSDSPELADKVVNTDQGAGNNHRGLPEAMMQEAITGLLTGEVVESEHVVLDTAAVLLLRRLTPVN
ncbi:MAG: P-loop NTPase fold protein [Pseudomonadota bacterium]